LPRRDARPAAAPSWSSLRDPDYLPFQDGPFRLAMGLLALKPEDWIEVGEGFAEQLRLKRALLAECHDDCFLALDGTEAAGAEVLTLLFEHLPARFPDIYVRDGKRLTILPLGETWQHDEPFQHPLDLAGRLVQEDLCLMRRDGDAWRLVAGSLCFPSRWRLAEKLGQPLAGIHAPVAFYKEKLEQPVDRFFGILKEERPVWRLNWTLHEDPSLFQPTHLGSSEITAESAGEKLFLRVERQTLRLLPRSGDVLFTIRTYVRALERLAGNAEVCRRFAAAIRALPPESFRYKGLERYGTAALAWLDRAAAA
jgi:dimethylamine monooxygenase subunit A